MVVVISQAFFVGEPSCPPLAEGDVLIASTGPSSYAMVDAVCGEARKNGGRVVAFSANKTAPVPHSDMVVRMPVSEPAGDSSKKQDARSVLVGSYFELSLHLALDLLASLLRQDSGMTQKCLAQRSFNIE